MQKSSIALLQAAIALFGLGVFALMLWEPLVEGRNVNATLFEVYFRDPFLACAYLASIPFFVGLVQVFKTLGYVQQGKLFSSATVKALRTIKVSAMLLLGFLVAFEGYLFVVQRGKEDDIAGGVAVGLFLMSVTAVVAVASAKGARILQRLVDGQFKNDVAA